MTAMLDDDIAELRRANADLQRSLDGALAERDEAQAEKAALAEVLEVINSSPGDLAPVFDAMLRKAMHVCEAAFGTMWTYDGEFFHVAALKGVPPAFAEFLREAPASEGNTSTHLRILRGAEIAHVIDAAD